MSSVNKVILVGNLGQDPEVRSLQGGGQVVTLSVATSEKWTDKRTGEKREKTEWHRVVVWNEALAKVAEQYLKKGAKVYIEGRLETRKWQDQSGQDRWSTEVVLRAYGAELVLLGGREAPSGAAAQPAPDRREPSGAKGSERERNPAPATRSGLDDLDDEIPF